MRVAADGGQVQSEAEWKAFDAATAEARRQSGRVEKMAYRGPGAVSVPARAADGRDLAAGGSATAETAAAIASLEERLRLAEQSSASRLEEVREQAREAIDEARRQTQQYREAALQSAQQVEKALAGFEAERDAYFAKVEREVVMLALAIAARILNREAMLDPLLLAGAVRVALGQLGETTGIRVRCPMEQLDLWREMLAKTATLAAAPEMVGDPSLAAGDCVIEARVGSVDLGVRAQLAEIERGFFDLLAQRPEGPGRIDATRGGR
jgi:flagellar assembly protein FliH